MESQIMRRKVNLSGPVHANREPEVKSSNYVENGAGTPPIPSASNRFSVHGGMGVRARYVDTFNKGGGGYQANLFKSPSPSVPATKPVTGNAKFFIPTPIVGRQETDTTPNPQEAVIEDTTTSNQNLSFSTPKMLTPQSNLKRHSSMEHIPRSGMGGMMNGNGAPLPHARQTLSWSGGLEDSPSHNSMMSETRPPNEALGFPPPTYMPDNAKPMPFPSNFTREDLQEDEF